MTASESARASDDTLSADELLKPVRKMLARLVRSHALERGDVEAAIAQLTETASAALGVTRTSVWQLSEDRSSLVTLDLFDRETCSHSAGATLDSTEAPRYFRALLEEERTISVSDASTDPRTSELAERYLVPHGITGLLDAPIWLSGKLVGVVCHEHVGTARVWAPWEELVAGTLADFASMILGSAERVRQERALEEYRSGLEELVDTRTKALRESELRMRILAEASARLASTLDHDAAVRQIAKVPVPELADWCVLYINREGRARAAEMAHAPDVDGAAFEALGLDTSGERTSALAEVIATGHGRRVVLPDSGSARPEPRALMIAPVCSRGGLCGALVFASRREDAFGERDLDIATELAHRAASALENARLYRESRQREQELAREQRFLNTVLATAPFGLAFIDRDGVYVRVNEWLARLNGVPAEETIGRRPSEVIQHDATGALVEEMVATVFRTGAPTETVELASPAESHHGMRHFLVTFYPVLEDSRVTHVGCCTIEITAQRHGELERADLLERERAARHEAESANRAKDEFLAMLGHELRNPLAPIVTALYLMRSLGDAASVERAIIERQVGHLGRLVDDLLDVSRITRGRIELLPLPIELSSVVAKGREMASPLIERHGHALEVDVPMHGLRVNGDLDRLAQVISNLLTNAAKYTPPGGKVHLRGRREGDEIFFSVRDTGVGIAPELLPRVFDVFVQGERRLERSQGGLGLGLAIVRGIVAAHGGRVSAYSGGRGSGSEFLVTLPALPDVAVSSSNFPMPPPQVRSLARRILVVDDNEDAAEMLARSLEVFGHEVRIAFDGSSAVDAAIEFRPDAALLDLGLPVMDGFELARRLRTMPELAGIKLVAVTGYGRRGDFERSKAAGFHEHLVKPIESTHLDRVIRDLFTPPPSGGEPVGRAFQGFAPPRTG